MYRINLILMIGCTIVAVGLCSNTSDVFQTSMSTSTIPEATTINSIVSTTTDLYYNGRRVGEIRYNGDVYIDGRRVGEIRSNGDVYVDGRREGEIRSNGDIYKNGRRVGEVRSNGDVYEDGRRVGEVRSNGDVYKNGSRIGEARNMTNAKWVAVIYFYNFFRL